MIRGPSCHSWSCCINEWIPILSKALEQSKEMIERWRFKDRDLVARWSTYSRLSRTDLPFLNPNSLL